MKHWRDGLLDGRAKATVNRIVSVLSAALELAANTDQRITARPWKVGLKKLRDANAHNARNTVPDGSAGAVAGRACLTSRPRSWVG